MQAASATIMHYPSTPASPRYSHISQNYRPLNSSPLASPSTPESPVAARRRTQYKSRTPSTPVPSSSRTFINSRAIGSSGGSVFASGGDKDSLCLSSLDPQKAFLREKFKARCFERAAKARARAIKGKRYQSEASSDGYDEAMDEDEEEEDDDTIMHDELFRRIMENANRKQKHSFRVSYAYEVGSSFDPDMDKADEWEHELNKQDDTGPSSSQSDSTVKQGITPVDLDDEEIEAYAEECARRAALADFEDIPEEELFNFSDVEELEVPRDPDEDVEMTH